MFCDLCVDAFEENRESTWKGVYKKMQADKYYIDKFPKIPEKKVEPPVEAASKKPARPKRAPRARKMGKG